jgi:hypothetical protein
MWLFVCEHLMASELPETLLRFIESCVPTYEAAELLLVFAAHPEREFTPEEIVESMRPAVITVSAVKEYAALFVACRLIAAADGRYRYGPSPQRKERLRELEHAYKEKPVTLINAIHRTANPDIRSFAAAFKLRDDEV